MVNTSRTETTLNDFESTSPSTNNVVKRDANVVVDNLVVTFGGVVVAELVNTIRSVRKQGEERAETTDHLHGTDEGQSLGVRRNDDDTLLLVLAGGGVAVSE